MSGSIAYTGEAAGELPFSLQWYVCRGQITSPGAATMPAVLQSQGATSLPPPRVQTASAESIWPSPRRVSPDPKAALTTTWLWLAPVVHACLKKKKKPRGACVGRSSAPACMARSMLAPVYAEGIFAGDTRWPRE
jgi:hypothetical protein